MDIYKAFPGNELDDLLGTFLQDDNTLTISTQLTAGSPFTVTSRWTNVNTAPAYIPWQGNSQLDLTKPFSTASQ